MEIRSELVPFIPMVKFLSKVLGNQTEVVLHDVTNPESSIIAIENNYISGRKVGDPVTNLVLRIIKDKLYINKSDMTNYSAYGINGKQFRSSSFFIKDDKDELVGMLCINTDVSLFVQMKQYLDEYCSFLFNDESNKISDLKENLSGNTQEVLGTLVNEAIQNFNVPPSRMNQDEKMKVLENMYLNGAFLLKGSIAEAAKSLNVSEPTIYRYLAKIKETLENGN